MFVWAEACNAIVYILNKCLHKILKLKTPEEAFTDEKPQAFHFRVFGYPLLIHVPDENIKLLRSYNIGEYTSKEFESFFRDVGIKRQLIIVNTL
jgi:transposase InsO family protein